MLKLLDLILEVGSMVTQPLLIVLKSSRMIYVTSDNCHEVIIDSRMHCGSLTIETIARALISLLCGDGANEIYISTPFENVISMHCIAHCTNLALQTESFKASHCAKGWTMCCNYFTISLGIEEVASIVVTCADHILRDVKMRWVSILVLKLPSMYSPNTKLMKIMKMTADQDFIAP